MIRALAVLCLLLPAFAWAQSPFSESWHGE